MNKQAVYCYCHFTHFAGPHSYLSTLNIYGFYIYLLLQLSFMKFSCWNDLLGIVGGLQLIYFLNYSTFWAIWKRKLFLSKSTINYSKCPYNLVFKILLLWLLEMFPHITFSLVILATMLIKNRTLPPPERNNTF